MKLIWMYDASTIGWWRVKDLPDGLHAQKVYGPFTGANKEAYNLVRKGPRIFAVGHDLSKCVYNHTREF